MDHSFTGADAQPGLAPSQWNHTDAGRRIGWNPWPVTAIVLMQAVLFLGHWLVDHTLTSFWPMSPEASWDLGVAFFILSLSFMITGLLGFRFVHPFVSALYKIAAIWLGILNFLFWAACLCWIADFAILLTRGDVTAFQRQWIAGGVFGTALLICLYGFVNARIIRKRRVTITLPNLPDAWRGRTALLISDMHLGNVNGAGFASRIARITRRLDPSVIFIAGDLFDGSKCNASRMAAPVCDLKAPFGTYFCGGNHEDFGDADGYFAALERGGIHVLHNERVDVDGLQVVGVSYADSTLPLHLRTFLDGLHLADAPASILLNHVPHRLPIAEKAGVSLQLSGHTHGGQIAPFTWVTRRAFGKFTYGLQQFGKMQVLTSSGVGTWGPPMRVGSQPEVVLITFA